MHLDVINEKCCILLHVEGDGIGVLFHQHGPGSVELTLVGVIIILLFQLLDVEVYKATTILSGGLKQEFKVSFLENLEVQRSSGRISFVDQFKASVRRRSEYKFISLYDLHILGEKAETLLLHVLVLSFGESFVVLGERHHRVVHW